MLTNGDSIRFTASEIEEAKKLGLDLSGVKTRADLVQAEIDLIDVLAEERFDLLEKPKQAVYAGGAAVRRESLAAELRRLRKTEE